MACVKGLRQRPSAMACAKGPQQKTASKGRDISKSQEPNKPKQADRVQVLKPLFDRKVIGLGFTDMAATALVTLTGVATGEQTWRNFDRMLTNNRIER